MVQLNWTRNARFALNRIFHIIADDNPEAAQRVVSAIYGKAQLLIDFPTLGQMYENAAGEQFESIRLLRFGHYRLAYQIEGDVISVLTVFHDRMDLERVMSQFLDQ